MGPEHPHWYTVRADGGDEGFETMRRLIATEGRVERFQGKPYRYLHLDGWDYWIGPRVCINRRQRDPDPQRPPAVRPRGVAL